MQRGVEWTVIPLAHGFSGVEAEAVFADLALNEELSEVGESETVICWMSTTFDVALSLGRGCLNLGGGTKSGGSCWPPRCREGVVERGEMLGDFDEPFCHRMVLQSSPKELGRRH